jgi:hypothetical protein
MSGLVDALVIVAVITVVCVRQFRAGRIDTDRRWWLLPTILTVVALHEPGTVDAHDYTTSVVLRGAELLIGLAVGVGWAWTTRIWVAPDGAVWGKSTRAGGVVWGVGIALRAGLFALGTALGVHQGFSALLLALAATLLVRSGILAWRVGSLHPAAQVGTAYGDPLPRPAWKERV